MWERKINCSDSVGWSNEIQFRTPPAGGSDELKFLAFGDMGKAPRDGSTEHYIQVYMIHLVLQCNNYMLIIHPHLNNTCVV